MTSALNRRSALNPGRCEISALAAGGSHIALPGVVVFSTLVGGSWSGSLRSRLFPVAFLLGGIVPSFL